MVLGHAAAGRRFGGRGGRGGWWGASVGGGAAQFRLRGELGLAPSENRRIGQPKLTKYPYLIKTEIFGKTKNFSKMPGTG